MLFSTYKNSHFIALTIAAAVHAAVGVWAIMPSSPIVINKQTIQVSFVAPSSQNQKSENVTHKKITMDLEQKNALKQKSDKNQENDQQKQKLASEKNISGKNTSGLVDPNAVAINSAQSEPIFDAAYLNNPSPNYPLDAKRKNIQGKVLVQVTVKSDGSAKEVIIARSSGYKSLDEAAIEAVRQWRFIPARKGSQSVQANVIVPVEFKII